MIQQRFDGAALDERLKWLNPPATWRLDSEAAALVIEPNANTDYWQRTHYGFQADNGHLLFAEVSSDVVLTTRVRFHPANQYDQAGLMVRYGPDCWVKTSVEYEGDQPQRLGAVITNGGYSDWSMQDFDRDRHEVWLRLTMKSLDCTVEFSESGESWTMLRLGRMWSHGGRVKQAGLYACSPKGAGFRAEFVFLDIEQS